METGVRAAEAECNPAFVDAGWGGAFKTADVNGPVSKAGESEGETTTEGFGHGFKGGFAVTAVWFEQALVNFFVAFFYGWGRC